MDLGSILSGPIGAIFGAVGAIGGKVIDLKMKALDHAHELALRDKDRETLVLELQNKSEIQRVDADTQVALRDFDAAAASMAADRATYGDSITGRIVDTARGLIRPLITSAAMTLVAHMTFTVLRAGDALSAEQRMEILRESLFLSGVAITWWFGSRPGGARGRK